MSDLENRRLWSALLLVVEMISALSDEVVRTAPACSEQNDYLRKFTDRLKALNTMLDRRAEAESSNADELQDTVREIAEGLLEERSNRPVHIKVIDGRKKELETPDV